MRTRQVVVGRIGRPHGIRGEVSVEPRTDEPDRRFVAGAVLATEAPRGPAPTGAQRPRALTVKASRWHQDRLLVTFEELADRTAAEAARGSSCWPTSRRTLAPRTPRSSTTTSSSGSAWSPPTAMTSGS